MAKIGDVNVADMKKAGAVDPTPAINAVGAKVDTAILQVNAVKNDTYAIKTATISVPRINTNVAAIKADVTTIKADVAIIKTNTTPVV